MYSFIVRVILIVSLLFGLPSGAQARALEEQIVAFTFDWDDNIFRMPTKIMVFHKQTGKEMPISTAEFAQVRSEIGKSGTKYADYEIQGAYATGSMRYFGDGSEDGSARFQKDMDTAMAGPPDSWKGPVWDDFAVAMSREATASHTWLITARLHAAGTIHAALSELCKRGLIEHVPPVANIWPVCDPDFPGRFRITFGVEPPPGNASNPSLRKAAVMEQILDQIEHTPLPASAPEVIGPDGKGKGRFHLWGFSDDDHGNVEKAIEIVQKGLDSGRWKMIKATIFFTGKKAQEAFPCAVTLSCGGKPRPYLEGGEWKKILEQSIGTTNETQKISGK
ncbi:MAG: hypothetical protein HQM08_26270 [Candidatus Riflebacteria bacterium]|nr:hypothetical protein [Candidatus Riflebacteria bacterium]